MIFENETMLTVNQTVDIIELLDEVLHTLCRGLPQYLVEAKPWRQEDDTVFLVGLRNLIADQRHYAIRIAAAVADRGGRPEPGPFPLEYASINDVSLDFLKKPILEQIRKDHDALTHIAKQLADQPGLHAMVEEIVGNYRGHLELLES